jgi:hypothetical protein
MTCRDFELALNELIDAEVLDASAHAVLDRPAIRERERALLEHAAHCPYCDRMNASYQGLRGALAVWGPPPSPSAGFAERALAKIQTPTPMEWPDYGAVRRAFPRRRVLISIMVGAAAASALIGLVLVRALDGPEKINRDVVRHVTALEHSPIKSRDFESVGVEAQTLNVALTEATEATWELARSASEPAARISRQMLDAATAPERGPAQPVTTIGTEPMTTVSVPSLDSLTPDAAAAGAILRQVGDRVATGVRPFSDTARHAFGFLLGSAPSKPTIPITPPAQKGA